LYHNGAHNLLSDWFHHGAELSNALMVISIIAAGLLVPLMVSFYYAMYAEALRSQVESSKDNAGDMSKYKPGAGLRIITGFQSVGGILLSILSAMLVSTENTTVTAMWVLIGFAVCLLGFGIYYVKKWSWVASIVVSLVSVFFVIVFILEASGSSSNQQTFFKIALDSLSAFCRALY
jgi:ABC-type multidrug transport system fused ATPase/permease subunit